MLILEKEIEAVIENTVIAFKKNYLQYTFEVLPKKIKEIYLNLNLLNEQTLEKDITKKIDRVIVLMFNLELIKEKERKEIKRKYVLTEKVRNLNLSRKKEKKNR